MVKPITVNQIQIDPTNLWLAIGGSPFSPVDTFEEKDAFLLSKIPASNTATVVKNIPWESGKIFYPWKSSADPDITPYYCVYNNILYLCLGNSPNNRIDESGKYLTSIPPSNTSSVPVMGSDGYTWLPLYYIDYTKEKFITDSDFPLPEFETTVSGSNFNAIYSNICPDGITVEGKCCLYYKEAITDKITGISYSAGSLLHSSVLSYCYECHDMAKQLDLNYKFTGNVGITHQCDANYNSVTLLNSLQKQKSSIPPNSTKSFQLNLLEDHVSHHDGVFQVEMNLQGISLENKIVTSPNPYLQIVDINTNELASVKLITTQLSDNAHEVIGISLESTGKNHIFPSFTVPGAPNKLLENSISLHTYPREIFEYPENLLKIKAFLVDTQVNVKNIKDETITGEFSKIALVSNPRNISDGTIYQAPPDAVEVKNLQTKFKVQVDSSATPPEEETGELGGRKDLEVIDAGNISQYNIITGSDIPGYYGLVNNSRNNYEVYISTIKTGTNLVEGEIFGFIKDDNDVLVPGFELEASDVAENEINVVEIGDQISVLGETGSVISVTPPVLSKNNDYFSAKNVDINIENLGPDVTLNFNIKVTT